MKNSQRSMAFAMLTTADQALIGPAKRLAKLVDLHMARREPETPAQSRFVDVVLKRAQPSTDYEFAYLRFLECLQRLEQSLIKRPANNRNTTVKPHRAASRMCDACGRESRFLKAGKTPPGRAAPLLCPPCRECRYLHALARRAAQGENKLNALQATRHAHEAAEKKRADELKRIADRNQRDLRKKAELERKAAERRPPPQVIPRSSNKPIPKVVPTTGRLDVDEFGLPYEEGVPRPGWRPLGRFQ